MESFDKLKRQKQEIELKNNEKDQRRANIIIHNLTVAMQAALIDAHHNGPQAAIEWIENTLDGPGLLPDKNDPNFGDAQAYFDANRIGP